MRADLCSDHPPPGKYGCDEQRDFQKCFADFMIAGDFCKRTCGRCLGAPVPFTLKTVSPNYHEPLCPRRCTCAVRRTCRLQIPALDAHSTFCILCGVARMCHGLMLLGELEGTLDGLIAGAGVCNDIPPPGEYTCEQQKEFGKCNENYIRDWGYCAETCMVCDSAFSLHRLEAPSQGLFVSRTSSVDCYWPHLLDVSTSLLTRHTP